MADWAGTRRRMPHLTSKVTSARVTGTQPGSKVQFAVMISPKRLTVSPLTVGTTGSLHTMNLGNPSMWRTSRVVTGQPLSFTLAVPQKYTCSAINPLVDNPHIPNFAALLGSWHPHFEMSALKLASASALLRGFQASSSSVPSGGAVRLAFASSPANFWRPP